MTKACREWFEREAAERRSTPRASRDQQAPWIQKPAVVLGRRLALAATVLLLLVYGEVSWQGMVARAHAPARGITAFR
jgi:hypothetical protein